MSSSHHDVAVAYVLAAKKSMLDFMKREGVSRSAVSSIIGTSPSALTRWLSDDPSQFFDFYHYVIFCIEMKVPPAVLLPPADWTSLEYQASLKYIIKLPERDLAMLLAIHKTICDNYPSAHTPFR
ncbi:hypothetical protein [Aeromonas veronii]|uniref:hypothetical protein n=1 Tax=Aeromonas veronii TaxID=654 RepID=UPI002B297FE4|nr:hypothetical protein VAWG002_43500 [Aeromonas veronii]